MAEAGASNMPRSLNPFAKATFVTLRTRLSPQECQRRLRAVTLPWPSVILGISWVSSALPLMGWVYPTGFAVRKRFLMIDGMQPEAKARFEQAADGTRMTVRLGTRRWVMILCFYGLGLAMVYAGGLQLLLGGSTRRAYVGAVVAVALYSTLMVLLLVNQRKGRDQAAFLVAFLKQALEAEEVPSRDSGGRTR
jgi:hypothetical protein